MNDNRLALDLCNEQVEKDERTKVMMKLLCELEEGCRSGDREGWVSEEAVREHFRKKGTCLVPLSNASNPKDSPTISKNIR